MAEYVVSGGFIFRQTSWGFPDLDPIGTVHTAADALVRLQSGPLICAERGHDYSVKGSAPRMWLCFRCDEPGWEVPLGGTA